VAPKKALSLSLNVKCDQQTENKMMPPIMASISRKSSNKVPMTTFQMLLAGSRAHKNEAFFNGLERIFMGLDCGKSKCYGFGLWE
jgi:hypothetical protein